MKITKDSRDASKLKSDKTRANAGCDVCPCCGENKYCWEYHSLSRGLSAPISRAWSEGVFKPKFFKVNCYRCNTCGAEWESDPYIWA